MNSRERFFERLAREEKSHDRQGALAALRVRLGGLRYGSGLATVDLFLQRAREAGSVVQHCATPSEAAAWLTGLAGQGRRCILADEALFAAMGLAELLAGRGWEVMTVTDKQLSQKNPDARRVYAEADIGLTVALAGLADSGAILMSSSQSESRSVSLLTAEHVVLLPARCIIPSLLQAAPMLRSLTGEGGTSAVTLVGGPSKTADIEKVLVTGVHGPGVLTIIVIDAAD